MSIVDSLKKMAVKLGRAQTPDEIYAPDITTALKQVAVGYGIADDPANVPGSSIDDVIDILAKNVQPGGGNPNRFVTIIGTVSNPFGSVSVGELYEALLNNDATAVIEFDSEGQHIKMPLFAHATAEDTFYGSGATMGLSPNEYTAIHLNIYAYRETDIISAYMVGTSTNNTVVDVSQTAAPLESTLTIIWHPLPDQG